MIELTTSQGFLQSDHVIRHGTRRVVMFVPQLADITTDLETGDVGGQYIDVLHHQFVQQGIGIGQYARRDADRTEGVDDQLCMPAINR